MPRPFTRPQLCAWTLDLDGRTPLTLNARHGHWAQRSTRVRELRDDVHLLVRAAQIPPLRRIHVVLELSPPDRRRRDTDNLVATLKVCIDGLVQAGVVPDDTPGFVSWEPPVLCEPTGQAGRWKMRLRVQERRG